MQSGLKLDNNVAPKVVADAQAFTRRRTYGHYENFPVASWLVPPRLRQHVCNIYAFSRIADDFADEAEFEGERMARLQDWRDQLHICAQRALGLELSQVDRERELHPVFVALIPTLRDFGLPIELFNDLITAFMLDTTKTRYNGFGEIGHYCRHSANPVGRLVLHLFGYVNESWMKLSDNICTALQLANFWQDVHVDLQKDRIYLPRDEMARFGVTEEQLLAREVTDGLRELIKFQVERTHGMFNAGRALCTTVPHPRLRLELKLTWLGGVRILEKIAANNFNPFVRPKLGATDWTRLIWRAWRWEN